MKNFKTLLNIAFLATTLLFISCNDDDEIINVEDLVVDINENPTNGQVIGIVQTNGSGAFSITSQTPTGALNIDASTGELTVADATLFDYEINPVITATVEVVGAANTGAVTISINNINELSAQDLDVTIDENPTNGQSIGTVQAAGDGTISYSITSQTPSGALNIDASTGELTVADAALFDYETNPVITANISVDNTVNTATAAATVNLNNINELSIQDFDATIDENPTNGQSIGTVQAAGDGTLSFSITSQTPSGALNIDVSTGELTVADATLFDFETNPVITVNILVDNSGNTATAIATINLNDLDNIEPFLSTSQTDYNAASSGDWIMITESEYNNLANNLNQITKAGTTDLEYSNVINGGYASENVSRANKTTTAIIPNNGYVIAFKYKIHSATNAVGVKIRQSSTANNSGFSDVGNPLPSHSGSSEDVFFVLKGSNNPVIADGYLGFFQSSSQGQTFLNTEGSYWQSGDALTLNNIYLNIPYKLFYQGLCTTQIQW